MPLDDAITPPDARYDVPPLPRGIAAEVPNPFRDDSADDAADSGVSRAAAIADTGRADDLDR